MLTGGLWQPAGEGVSDKDGRSGSDGARLQPLEPPPSGAYREWKGHERTPAYPSAKKAPTAGCLQLHESSAGSASVVVEG